MTFRNLLVNVGLAVGRAAAKFDPSGVAELLLDAYRNQREKQQLRLELEALMRADFARFRNELRDAMGDDRLQLAEGVRAQIEAYLSQFQASARQAARQLGDPSATTVPATVSVDSAADLAKFLPQRPPRFTVGAAVPGLPSWTLTEPLGAGGFGEVWKAENRYGNPRVAAFKFFLDPSARGRFTEREAEALVEIHGRASTDGVVKLLGAEPKQDPPWLQFEYVPGGDLSRLPDDWKELPDAERVWRVREVVRTLAATVGHLHELGVVHRDLKPSNVLLRGDGSLVVADFGISTIVPAGGRAATPADVSRATIHAYTAAYASPQQKRFLPADRRDDVYALAVLWYQLLRADLSLDRPSGDGWKKVLEGLGVPTADIALLNRCWDDEPHLRPASGCELEAILKAGVEDARRAAEAKRKQAERHRAATPAREQAERERGWNREKVRRAVEAVVVREERLFPPAVGRLLVVGLLAGCGVVAYSSVQSGASRSPTQTTSEKKEPTKVELPTLPAKPK